MAEQVETAPSDFHLGRACEVMNADRGELWGRSDCGTRTVIAVARYIALHEPEPEPVDPLLLEAREILKADWPRQATEIDDGQWDDGTWIQHIQAGLKRGIEIGQGAA